MDTIVKGVAVLLFLVAVACATPTAIATTPTTEEIEQQQLSDLIVCMQSCISDAKAKGLTKPNVLVQVCTAGCVCAYTDGCQVTANAH